MRTLVLLAAWFACGAFADEAFKPLVTARAGAMPVVLSAPHGGREPIPGVPVRDGAGVARFTTVRDENTAELAMALASELERRTQRAPFLVVAHFERKYVDANRAPAQAYEVEGARPHYEAYHAALRDHCDTVRNRWQRGLLLDLHGQAQAPTTIFRGTADGLTIKALRERSGMDALCGPAGLVGHLERVAHHLVVPPSATPNALEDTRYDGGHIVRSYGSHQDGGLDAIQLEIGSDLRKRDRLERTANELADAILAFAEAHLPKP